MARLDLTNVTFTVEHGDLVMRAVAKSSGRAYRHSCPLADFETIAHEIDEAGAAGIGRGDLYGRTKIPWSRANVALQFMLSRGSIERAGPPGAHLPGNPFTRAVPNVHLDALTEYYALAEGA